MFRVGWGTRFGVFAHRYPENSGIQSMLDSPYTGYRECSIHVLNTTGNDTGISETGCSRYPGYLEI